MKFADYLNEKGISQDKLTEKSAEELAGLYNEYNEKTREAINRAIEEKASKEDIAELKTELSENLTLQMKELNNVLKEQGMAISKMNRKGSDSEPVNFSDFIRKSLTENVDTLKNIKSGNKSSRLEVKVPGTITSANISGGNVPVEQRIPGLSTVPSRRVRLLDIVQRGTAQSNLISWVSQANKDGAAGQTGEGALKNQIDFDLVVNQEALKKTTAYIKVSEEMLEDIDFLQSEINNELMREVVKAVESQVYSGDGTGNNHNGIRTTATAFAAGSFAGTVDNANLVDVLRVAMNQIALAEHDRPNYIMLNPSDVTALKLIKVTTTDKRYIDQLQMVAGQMTLDGVPIIETTLVAADEYLVGNFDLSTVWDRGSVSMEVGRENDDFTKNLVTILAEWRGLTIVKDNDRTAFVKGVISTDAAALETP